MLYIYSRKETHGLVMQWPDKLQDNVFYFNPSPLSLHWIMSLQSVLAPSTVVVSSIP